jgi:hypothetical protein
MHNILKDMLLIGGVTSITFIVAILVFNYVDAQEVIYHQVYQKPKEVGGKYCYSVNGTEQWCSNFRQIMIYNYSAMTEQDQKYIDESMRLQKYFKNGKAPQ